MWLRCIAAQTELVHECELFLSIGSKGGSKKAKVTVNIAIIDLFHEGKTEVGGGRPSLKNTATEEI